MIQNKMINTMMKTGQIWKMMNKKCKKKNLNKTNSLFIKR